MGEVNHPSSRILLSQGGCLLPFIHVPGMSGFLSSGRRCVTSWVGGWVGTAHPPRDSSLPQPWQPGLFPTLFQEETKPPSPQVPAMLLMPV